VHTVFQQLMQPDRSKASEQTCKCQMLCNTPPLWGRFWYMHSLELVLCLVLCYAELCAVVVVLNTALVIYNSLACVWYMQQVAGCGWCVGLGLVTAPLIRYCHKAMQDVECRSPRPCSC
jgi:hypothetical protein